MSKEIKCFLGKDNPSAICVNKADYIRLRNKIKETKIRSRNEALQEAIEISREKVYCIKIENIECGVIDVKRLNERLEALMMKKEKQEGK